MLSTLCIRERERFLMCVCVYIYRPMSSTLCIQVPFGRLEKATNKSSWCAQHAADLSSGHAWWNRLRYLVAVVQVLTIIGGF